MIHLTEVSAAGQRLIPHCANIVGVPAKEEDAPYRQYTRSLLLKTGYRATWWPGELIELGAVGLLSDGLFDQRARLSDFGVSIVEMPNSGSTDVEYQSSAGVKTSFKAAGESSEVFQAVGAASAGVRLDFSRSGAVVFSAPNCRISEIDNKRSLERKVRAIGDWEMDWVIVTKILRAPSATILVSGSVGAFAELRTSAGIAPQGVEIADLAVGFTRARTSGMSVQLVAKGDLTPLYQASAMRQPSLTRDRQKRHLVRV